MFSVVNRVKDVLGKLSHQNWCEQAQRLRQGACSETRSECKDGLFIFIYIYMGF